MSKKDEKKSGSRSAGKNPTVEMVRQLARIVDTHALTELILETEEANITMRRGGTCKATRALMPRRSDAAGFVADLTRAFALAM